MTAKKTKPIRAPKRKSVDALAGLADLLRALMNELKSNLETRADTFDAQLAELVSELLTRESQTRSYIADIEDRLTVQTRQSAAWLKFIERQDGHMKRIVELHALTVRRLDQVLKDTVGHATQESIRRDLKAPTLTESIVSNSSRKSP